MLATVSLLRDYSKVASFGRTGNRGRVGTRWFADLDFLRSSAVGVAAIRKGAKGRAPIDVGLQTDTEFADGKRIALSIRTVIDKEFHRRLRTT